MIDTENDMDTENDFENDNILRIFINILADFLGFNILKVILNQIHSQSIRKIMLKQIKCPLVNKTLYFVRQKYSP